MLVDLFSFHLSISFTSLGKLNDEVKHFFFNVLPFINPLIALHEKTTTAYCISTLLILCGRSTDCIGIKTVLEFHYSKNCDLP